MKPRAREGFAPDQIPSAPSHPASSSSFAAHLPNAGSPPRRKMAPLISIYRLRWSREPAPEGLSGRLQKSRLLKSHPHPTPPANPPLTPSRVCVSIVPSLSGAAASSGGWKAFPVAVRELLNFRCCAESRFCSLQKNKSWCVCGERFCVRCVLPSCCQCGSSGDCMPFPTESTGLSLFSLFFPSFFTSLQICDHSGKFIKFYFAVDEIPPSHVFTLSRRFKARGIRTPPFPW